MGIGIDHTPFFLPTKVSELPAVALSHVLFGLGGTAAAYAITGSYAGPGVIGTIYHAMFSPSTAYVGGHNSLASTTHAMSVYAEPFVAASRIASVPLAAAALIGIVGVQTSAMQDFTAGQQLQILSGVSTPSSSEKHKLLSLSGL